VSREGELRRVHGSSYVIHNNLSAPVWHLKIIPNALSCWRIAL
jgi:hypothetical protein